VPLGEVRRQGISRNIQKLGGVVLSCSTAIVVQHATEAALALDRSVCKGLVSDQEYQE
jgi:hypothetical protein